MIKDIGYFISLIINKLRSSESTAEMYPNELTEIFRLMSKGNDN